MDHGKFRNYIQGGSFVFRSYCAALYYNEGKRWLYTFWIKHFSTDDCIFSKLVDRIESKYTEGKKWKINNPKTFENDLVMPKNKIDFDYGESASTYFDNEMIEKLYEKMIVFMNTLKINKEKQEYIKVQTINQRNDQIWYCERRTRLTASNWKNC